MVVYLQRQDDGSYIDWGRYGPAREGPARWYKGEDACIIKLVLQYSQPYKRNSQPPTSGRVSSETK